MNACLILVGGESGSGRSCPLLRDVATIVGRGKQCDIVLDDPSISGKHCRIEYAEGGWQIQDLDSTNGVFVNSQRVNGATLGDGDTLRLGAMTLRLAVVDPDACGQGAGDAEPAVIPEGAPPPVAQDTMPPVRSVTPFSPPPRRLLPLVAGVLLLALGVLGWVLLRNRDDDTDMTEDVEASTSQRSDGADASGAGGPATRDPAGAQAGSEGAASAGHVVQTPDVQIIDQDTYVLVQPFAPRTEPRGRVLAFSPDCRLALVLGAGENLLVRDLSAPAQTVEFSGCRSGMAVFSPSGDRVAAASPDAKVQIWSTSTGEELQSWQRQEGRAFQIFFSEDGEFLVTIARASVTIWNTGTGEEARLFDPGAVKGMPMALSTAGQSVLLNRKSTFVIRDLKTQKEQAYAPGSGSSPNGNTSAISPDFSVVAQAGSRLRVMKIAEQSHSVTDSFLAESRGATTAMDLSPGGKYLLIGGTTRGSSHDGDVAVWDIAQKRVCWSSRGKRGRSGTVTAVAFSPQTKRILAAYQDGRIRVWERVPEPDATAPSGGIPPAFAAVALDPNRYHLNFPLGKAGQQRVEATPTRSFSADAERTAWTNDGTVYICDTSTGAELFKMAVPRDQPSITCVALSPDGKILATGSAHSIVEVFEVDTGKKLWRLTGHDNLQKARLTGEILGNIQVQFIRGSDRFVSHAMSGKLHVFRLWDTETGEPLLTIRGKRGGFGVSPVITFATDSRGAKLLAGTKEFGLYDVETGKQLSTFAGHDASVGGAALGKYPLTRLALSESHTHAASWVQADKMKVWDASGRELLAVPWASKLSSYGWWVSWRPRVDRLGRTFGPKDKGFLSLPAGENRRLLNLLMRQEPWWVAVADAAATRKTIQVNKWNGQQVIKLATLDHGQSVYAQASASPDGTRFGTLARTNAYTKGQMAWARVWDLKSEKELQQIGDHNAYLGFVALGGNPDRFFSWGSGHMYVWGPPPDFLLAAQRPLPKDHVVWGFTEDCTQLVSGTKRALSDPDFMVNWKTEFRVWDALTGAEIPIDRTATLGIRPTDGRPELKRIVAVVGARRGKATGAALLRFVDPRAPKLTSPDGRLTIVVAKSRADSMEQALVKANGNEVILQRGATGETIHTLAAERPLTAVFSDDGRTVAVGSGNGVVTLFDVKTGATRAVLPSTASAIGCLCFTPDGKYIVGASTDRSLVVWDVASHRQLLKAYLFLRPACALRFLPGGRVLASATDDGHIRFWDLQRLLKALAH